MCPVYCVPETVHTDVPFREMQRRKVHIAVVVDEYGGMSGIVTMEDLLEEIVGNIYDEFDPQDEQEIMTVRENLWRISGATEIEKVEEALGVDLPEDEYDTLGGLIYSRLNTIPEDGSHPVIEAYGLHIRAKKRVRHKKTGKPWLSRFVRYFEMMGEGVALYTVVFGSTEWVSHTLPPITEPAPTTVSPPRMVAPE